MTNLARWTALAQAPPTWPGRSATVAAFIAPGSRVLDIGAGAQGLRDCLPPGCAYQPMDCVAGPGVLHVDFDAGAIPDLGSRYDVAVLAGVLEHLADPLFALDCARRWAASMLFTYQPAETCPPGVDGGHPRMREADLLQAARGVGLAAVRVGGWQEHGVYRA